MIQAVLLFLLITGGIVAGAYTVIKSFQRRQQQKLLDDPEVFNTLFSLLTDINDERESVNKHLDIEDALVDLHLKSAFCPNLSEQDIRKFVKKRFE